MLGLKLNHINKRAPKIIFLTIVIMNLFYDHEYIFEFFIISQYSAGSWKHPLSKLRTGLYGIIDTLIANGLVKKGPTQGISKLGIDIVILEYSIFMLYMLSYMSTSRWK